MAGRVIIDRTLGARGPMQPDDAEARQVEAWRKLRMSWTAIARNLNRAEADVRRAYDPDYARAAR